MIMRSLRETADVALQISRDYNKIEIMFTEKLGSRTTLTLLDHMRGRLYSGQF